MRPYSIVPNLPRNLPNLKFNDDLAPMDYLIWDTLCRYADWTGAGLRGSKAADNENDLMTGYCVVDYRTLMADVAIQSKDTLYKSLKKLEKRGFIERKYHGPMIRTEYILHAPKPRIEEQENIKP